MVDLTSNPKDPLPRAGTENMKILFDNLSKVCSGFSAEDVIGAAANVLVNATRQAHASWPNAEQSFSNVFGRSKQVLHDCYDTTTGRRRSIFPFNQVIQAPHFVDPDVVRNKKLG